MISKTTSSGYIAPNQTLTTIMRPSLDLAVYRHWSLFESLLHSANTATSFKIWTSFGMKKMHQFFAEMGIPLSQCKQRCVFGI